MRLSPYRLKSEAGFTLLEVVLYLALFGTVIGVVTVTGFALKKSAEKSAAALALQQEAGFIEDKLKWLVGNATVITPRVNERAQELVLSSAAGPGNLTIRATDNHLQIEDGTQAPRSLTSASNTITEFTLNRTPDNQLIINFNLNGREFSYRQQLIAP